MRTKVVSDVTGVGESGQRGEIGLKQWTKGGETVRLLEVRRILFLEARSNLRDSVLTGEEKGSRREVDAFLRVSRAIA